MCRWKHHIMLVLALLMCSCASQENPDSPGLGRMRIKAVVEAVDADLEAVISLTVSTRDGVYSRTWSDIDDFPSYESFYVGPYVAKAFVGQEGSEGFDCPYYEGTADFNVTDGVITDVSIVCTLSQAMVCVHPSADFVSAYPDASFTLHSSGAGYIDIGSAESGYAYISPGSTGLFVTISDGAGGSVTLSPNLCIPTVAAEKCDINVALADGNVLVASCGDRSASVKIDESLFTSKPPHISCSGFDDGVSVSLTEGYPSNSPLIMTVESEVPLRSVMLTSTGMEPLMDIGSLECNLLDENCPLVNHGLSVSQASDGSMTVDFTHIIEMMSVTANSDVHFIMQACDILGRVSAPAYLSVNIKKVDITVAGLMGAVIGEDIATVMLDMNVPLVQPQDFTVMLDDDGPNGGQPLPVVSSSLDETAHKVTLKFAVPEGISDVPVHINYMDNKGVVVKVPRIVPEYSLDPDAFAATARLKVVAQNPKSIAAITRYARLMVDGSDLAILERDIEAGILVCTGLLPDKTYRISSVVVDGGFSPYCTFTTESALQIPDGDFEDAVLSIKHNRLASGGIYSSTSFPIFNRQNYTDVLVYFPKKYWASVNSKTFCKSASNHNTWYMQPSSAIDFSQAVSGSKSMRLTSVGWSLHGEQIEPYIQAAGDYVPYSCNVPAIDHISAGYLFLGSYSFDANTLSESCSEGIQFKSRPSSLNGFFKYTSDVNNLNDMGWVKVEVINVSDLGIETVIASGEMQFSNAPYFRAFNLPLVYGVYNMKASKVKIMFCSSIASLGLSLDNPSIPVSANIPEAYFAGSSLWIDNLSFSY